MRLIEIRQMLLKINLQLREEKNERIIVRLNSIKYDLTEWINILK